MSVKHGSGESSITLSLDDMVDVLYSSNNRTDKGMPHLDTKHGQIYDDMCNSDYSSDEYNRDFDEESFKQIIAERQAERENYWISKCEADKLANQLIAEEKLEKEKEEKKKAKKKKKKERQKAKNKDKGKTDNSSEKDENEEKQSFLDGSKGQNEPVESDERQPLPSSSSSSVTGLARGEMEHSECGNARLSSEPVEDEDGIDTSSAFFSRLAGKAPSSAVSITANKATIGQVKTKPVRTATESSKYNTESNRTNSTNINTKTNERVSNTSPDGVTDLVRKSRELAIEANRMAAVEKYTDAIRLFKEAIKINSTDFRFFGNRSFCYERIGEFKSALADADSAIALAPQWPKGHYRKGRSLVGLNKYKEAEAEFEIVIQLEGDSQDAMFELTRVRTLMLMDMGFDAELATIAVSEHETFQAALDALLEGRVEPESDVYSSNDEDGDSSNDSEPFTLATSRTSQNKSNVNKESAKKSPAVVSPVQTTSSTAVEAKQPLKSCAVWVGNINPDVVSESILEKLFNRCGRVAFVKILPSKKCAFVNYDRVTDAELAIEKLQNAELGGKNLFLKFSNNPPPGYVQSTAANASSSAATSKSSGTNRTTSKPSSTAQQECTFWRAGGCTFADKCHYRHIPEHRGIEKR